MSTREKEVLSHGLYTVCTRVLGVGVRPCRVGVLETYRSSSSVSGSFGPTVSSAPPLTGGPRLYSRGQRVLLTLGPPEQRTLSSPGISTISVELSKMSTHLTPTLTPSRGSLRQDVPPLLIPRESS